VSAFNINSGHRTLHKIHSFVEAQQEKTGFKLFFRQSEMSNLLKSCTSGLDQARDVFVVRSSNAVAVCELIKRNFTGWIMLIWSMISMQ
jgi:3-dehydroquinate dehydratase